MNPQRRNQLNKSCDTKHPWTPSALEKSRFYTPNNIGEPTPKNEGNVGSHGMLFSWKIIGTASMLFFWGAHCEKMSNPWCDLMIQTSQMGTPEGFMALDSRRISPNREITQTGKHQTLLPTHDTVTSWSFQPIWKICSSKWESSPIFGVNIKKWNHHPANDTVINHCLIEFEPKQDQTGPNNQPMGSMVVNACLYGKEMDFPIPDLCQRQRVGKIMKSHVQAMTNWAIDPIHGHPPPMLSNFLLWIRKLLEKRS